MKIISYTIGFLVLTAIVSIWRGFVLSKLWAWFFAATFELPLLSLAQAVGVSLVVSFLAMQYDPYQDKEKPVKERMIAAWVYAIISPGAALFMGVIVKWFI